MIKEYVEINPKPFKAAQYSRDGLEAEEIAKWCGGSQTDEGIEVENEEGKILCKYGDYIVEDEVLGSFWVVDKEDFEKEYKEV